MMHVLITGGAGFIGSHVAQWHIERGDRVHIVDDLSTGRRENLDWAANNPNLRFDHEDIRRWHGLDAATQWADRVYHLAAVVGMKRVLQDPVRVVEVNIHSTDYLLQCIQKSNWRPEILIASSSEVYAHNPAEQFKEDEDVIVRAGKEVRWCYAVSKLTDEFLAKIYHSRFQQKIVVVRLFNTIGPRQVGTYGMVVPSFVGQAVVGDDITIYGDGTQRRSFCDVRDTVEVLTRLAANPAAHGQIVNVGNAQEIDIKSLAELVRERAQSRSKITYTSYEEAYGEGFEDVFRRRPDLTLQTQLTDYKPRWTLVQTIDDLIETERKRAAALYRAAKR